MGGKKKAALHNLGCKVNAYETEAMQQILENAGYEIVPFAETADVYVVNTCSVTNMADRKSRQMIHRARKKNPEAIVVAVGCYVQTKEAEAASDSAIDIIIGNNRKGELAALLKEYEETHRKRRSMTDINREKQEYEALFLEKTSEHTRAFIKVQDGCSQFCSYCIIPFARGRVRSRREEEIIKEVGHLARQGYHEVVLTGIHLSSYGMDTGGELLHLITEVHQVEGIERIRLGSLEPRIVTEEFAEALSKLPKICPHFHLSLQSGCDETLKRMNRRYNTAEYEEVCRRIRNCLPHPAITTDVIVGFPGETESEFEATENFLKKIRFYEMHIFQYSKREGTKAALMPDQVPEPVKKERSNALLSLNQEMSREFREYYLGRTVTVLLEEEWTYQGVRYMAGYTKEYVKAAVKAERGRINELVTGKIEKQLHADVYLMVEF